MGAIAIWRWVLLRLVRSPGVWVFAVGLLAAFLLSLALRPLSGTDDPLSAALPWMHPCALVGVALALVALSDGEIFLTRLAPATRYWGEFGALLAAATYLQLPILAVVLFRPALPVDPGVAVAAILTADLQLASVSLLLLLPALPTALRASLYLACVVLVPALCTHLGWSTAFLSFLDADATLHLPVRAVVSPALAAGASLALVGYLMRAGPSRAPAGMKAA